jgi:hypothetical protein
VGCHDGQDVSGPQNVHSQGLHLQAQRDELRNTLSTSGYAPAQNMYHVLDLGNDDDSSMDITMATQVSAVATGTGTLAARSLG